MKAVVCGASGGIGQVGTSAQNERAPMLTQATLAIVITLQNLPPY